MILHTPRLELVTMGIDLARCVAARDVAELARRLAARVPAEWPPELMLDLLPTLVDFTQRSAGDAGWAMWFVITRADRTLVGCCGFKGPPDAAGRVDTGYSVLGPWQRRGYATEAVGALAAWAFRDERVARIIGETFPELAASIRVLERCGFRLLGTGVGHEGEPEVLQYELRRPSASVS